MTDFSELPPNLIFGKILSPCPTKFLVELSFLLSKRYWVQDAVSSYSSPVLDLDESDDFHRHNLKVWDLVQHKKFARFVDGYLEFYREKGHQLLDKLRLVMKLNSSEDAAILGRWLELGFERGVKDLEISGPNYRQPGNLVDHPLSWMTSFANAKSLTSLKLRAVSLTAFGNTWEGTDDFPLLFPSLKTLSLCCLYFVENDDSLYKLLHTCSSIEHLSLTNISFEHSEFRPTLNLKSLEFIECNLPQNFDPVQIDTLESFTWIGFDELFSWEMVLDMAGKSLTCLRLEKAWLDDFPRGNDQGNMHFFPSLKTISFANIRELDLLPVLSECPSLENLSLVECGFIKSTCSVRSSTLKSLEVKHCRRLEHLQVHEAKNLEYFMFFSQPFKKKIWRGDGDSDSDSDIDTICAEVILDNSFNLKNNNIRVTDLVKFSVNGLHYESGCHLSLKAFFDGIAAPYARNNINISKDVFFN